MFEDVLGAPNEEGTDLEILQDGHCVGSESVDASSKSGDRVPGNLVVYPVYDLEEGTVLVEDNGIRRLFQVIRTL